MDGNTVSFDRELKAGKSGTTVVYPIMRRVEGLYYQVADKLFSVCRVHDGWSWKWHRRTPGHSWGSIHRTSEIHIAGQSHNLPKVGTWSRYQVSDSNK